METNISLAELSRMQLNITRFYQFWGTIRTEASHNQEEEFSGLE